MPPTRAGAACTARAEVTLDFSRSGLGVELTGFVTVGAALTAGVIVQRRRPDPRATRLLWEVGHRVITPAAVFVGFTLVPLSSSLVVALVGAVLSSYVSILVALGYGRWVGRTRAEAGALALAAGFGNTAALGYAFAGAVFGDEGLALMVVFSQFAWIVPQSALTTAIASTFASADGPRRLSRAIVVNPPLIVGVIALAARLTTDATVAPAQLLAGVVLGLAAPYGFFVLGASIPLERVRHQAGDLSRAAGALVLRFTCAPLALLAFASLAGVPVPGAFYLGAAMPCAFHLVTLSRVFGVRPHLMRSLVVSSTVLATIGVAIWMSH